MPNAIQIEQTGGPEVMQWIEVDTVPPGEGEVLLRQTAVGLNFVDIYFRSGLYKLPSLPHGLGAEAAGVVEAAGAGVTDLAVGDRVAYVSAVQGAYAEQRVVPADRCVKLPDGISETTAAAMMLRGLTAHYLLRRTYRVQSGDTILVHAAAGGVGLILCSWARALGATVIGTVGSPEKAELAREYGCTHTIDYTTQDFVAEVKRITSGTGVPVVYDSVGKDTFEGSLDCLRPLGMMVTFGNASGPVPAVEPVILSQKGSIFLTRPTLFHYIAARADLLSASNELFAAITSGAVQPAINQEYALIDVAQAHRDLESRKTTGSTVLFP